MVPMEVADEDFSWSSEPETCLLHATLGSFATVKEDKLPVPL